MNKKKKQYYFELVDVLSFMLKWKKHLTIITVSAAVLAIIFSGTWFIKPKYLSTAIFYPSTNNSISSALLTDSRIRSKDHLEFGQLDAAQQYVQLLESDYLKQKVIVAFNLDSHYRINPNDKERNFKLGRMYAKNISVKKTPYASIEINVLDEDPVKAADIANGVVSILDTVKNEVHKQVARQALGIIEKEYQRKQEEINEIKSRIREIGLKGVYDVAEQSKALTELAGKNGSLEYIKKQQNALAEFGAEANSLSNTLTLQVEQLNELKKKYDQAKIDVEEKLSSVFIIQTASPAERKTYPVRSVIVMVSALGAFVLGCVVLLLVEKFKNTDFNNLA